VVEGSRGSGCRSGCALRPRCPYFRANPLIVRPPPSSLIFGEPYTLPVPSIWRAEAANGLEIVGIQSNEVPLIEFAIDFDAGKNRATARPSPVWPVMMGDLLLKGAGDRDTAAFEEALGNLGSELNVSPITGVTTIRGKTLARNLDATVQLVNDMINAPAF